ncbi:peptidoglycan editing factor PgeF [Sandaracinobacteroides saxicola]|uniref:Purine nucleoside phosphorylase n=1 Tax=Sandaracinobacteroides saxicola TaxID=2759707 RepID=A0A7G5IG72_9SPHN|nr:peptidoglycan editing factor PgeF [Sandaracinobacteroides saxicola]QMW22364.1 peptidoglycan editing factor PgeF [Sandaracinobacteroides saxicola]
MITRLESPLLAGVRHGFLGRTGGVSAGIFASLNMGLGSSDEAPAVRENRARGVAAVAPGARLVTLHQVHSATVVEADAWGDAARPHADGVVSATRGLLLGILTADCAPVLFAEPEAGVVGAAHAGWKGALGGVLENTVGAMEALGARRDRISAVIGPCIARGSYEVGEAFATPFLAGDPADARFFHGGRPGHLMFDLEGYCAARLAAAGVARIGCLGVDTYADAARFFSFRRTTHRGEPDYGRQISLIGL